MRKLDLKNYTRYRTVRNFLNVGIAVTGLLLAIIAILSYFGTYAGTFVISIDELSDHSISISETRDFQNPTTYLSTDSKENVWPIAYKNLNINDITQCDGNYYAADNYIAYTFYLRNVGETIVDITYTIDMTRTERDLYKCARIMIIQNNNPLVIYRWEDDYVDVCDETPIRLCENYNSSNVCTNSICNLKPGDTIKYTIIIWLEGWDKDCTDDKKGGAICYNMKFKIVNYYELD